MTLRHIFVPFLNQTISLNPVCCRTSGSGTQPGYMRGTVSSNQKKRVQFEEHATEPQPPIKKHKSMSETRPQQAALRAEKWCQSHAGIYASLLNNYVT